MKKLIMSLILVYSSVLVAEDWKNPWSQEYHNQLTEKLSEQVPNLANFPSLQYPNEGHEKLPELFPDQKVLLFGYGSLMNKQSASRSLSPETLATMKPVVAFGLQRIFNYKAKKTDHWGANQDKLEKAMLNLYPTTSYKDVVNGVSIEVNAEDLPELVRRETGYDLVPILIADWSEISEENPTPTIKVAYTFIVPLGLRNHIEYTSVRYYPVRGYMHAAQEGALEYGENFLDLWNHTTYLADGLTDVTEWDQLTFTGILCSDEP